MHKGSWCLKIHDIHHMEKEAKLNIKKQRRETVAMASSVFFFPLVIFFFLRGHGREGE